MDRKTMEIMFYEGIMPWENCCPRKPEYREMLHACEELESELKKLLNYRSKNAKKYRQGVEYGSARWGTEKDIQPYIDPIFENNIILTETEWLMMSSRPRIPKYARNKNILVIGGSGSGKTRFFVKPNLMQMHSSYVVTDPKGLIC